MEDAQQKRLRWRCRRGARELDLVLLHYLDTRYASAGQAERVAFQRLLEADDPDLLDWLNGRARPADPALAGLVDALRARPVTGRGEA